MTQQNWVLTFLHVEVSRRFGRKVSKAQMKCLKTLQVFYDSRTELWYAHFFKTRLDPHEVRFACLTEIQYLQERDAQEDPTGAEARAQSGRNPFGLKSIDTNKGCARAATPPLTFGVYGSAPQRESNQFSQQHHSLEAQRDLLSVACQEDVFHVVNPFFSLQT